MDSLHLTARSCSRRPHLNLAKTMNNSCSYLPPAPCFQRLAQNLVSLVVELNAFFLLNYFLLYIRGLAVVGVVDFSI